MCIEFLRLYIFREIWFYVYVYIKIIFWLQTISWQTGVQFTKSLYLLLSMRNIWDTKDISVTKDIFLPTHSHACKLTISVQTQVSYRVRCLNIWAKVTQASENHLHFPNVQEDLYWSQISVCVLCHFRSVAFNFESAVLKRVTSHYMFYIRVI